MAAVSPENSLFERDVYTVSRLNREARAVLEGSFPLIWVEGELSNLSQPTSGHLYFSLKDEAAQVRCALFRMRRQHLRFRPENGMQVRVRARVSLYEGRGDFQLVVEHMEPAGEGALQQAVERLKKKLAAEGLFDQAVKQPIPSFPRQIGLVTSPSGAAVRDLLTVLRRRFTPAPVVIYPVQVQGEGAADQIVRMLALANARNECDVLVLARGGGSLEDLMPFNQETVARAIRASGIPLVTGIGHEIDFTIADLVADRRAATPSAAAELVSPDQADISTRLTGLERRLAVSQGRRLAMHRERVAGITTHLRLLHPGRRLLQQAQRLDGLEQRLRVSLQVDLKMRANRLASLGTRLRTMLPSHRLERGELMSGNLARRLNTAMSLALEAARHRLQTSVRAMDAVSPLGTLQRGYSVTLQLPDGKILRHPDEVEIGDTIESKLAGGSLVSRVESKK